jgi:hypothetical protein
MSNPNSKEDNQSSIKENMQNHIFSVLKGAGVIEGNDNEFYDDLEESNGNFLKEESFDIENLNIKSSSYIQETSNNPSLFKNEEISGNKDISIYRNDSRKLSKQK